MCRILRVSKSGYYKWLHYKDKADRKNYNKYLLKIINAQFVKFKGRYGSHRLTKEINKLGVVHISKNTTARYMQRMGLYAQIRRKSWVRTTISKDALPVYANLVNRKFHTEYPNKIWVSDITYIKYQNKFAYSCVILDLFSRKIVSWSVKEHMETSLIIEALDKAVSKEKPGKGLIFHSDRGSQYASYEFKKKLQSYSMLSSMSRKGDCWDNAVAESFFKTLKQEEVYKTSYDSLQQIKNSLFEYIDIFYNRQRIHSYLNYKTPIQVENEFYDKMKKNAS